MKKTMTITIDKRVLDTFRKYTRTKGYKMSSVVEKQVKEWLKEEGIEMDDEKKEGD